MDDTTKPKRNLFFIAVRIAVVICGIIWGIVWISRDVGWANLVDTFKKINPLIFILANLIFALGQIIIGLRWWILLRSQSIFIKLSAAVKLHFLGLFYNNFMPSSVGGDLVRAWYVTRHTDKRIEAALSVFVDRAIGLFSTFVIASSFYLIFLRGRTDIFSSAQQDTQAPAAPPADYKTPLFLIVLALVLIVLITAASRKGRLATAKIWKLASVRGKNAAKKIIRAVIIYSKSPGTILAVFALTVFMQLMVITGFYFIGRNLGIEASSVYYYTSFTLTWVVGAIPVSIGGAVVVEGSLIIFFTRIAGAARDAASALALSQRAVWMLTSLPGAFIHLFGAHLPGEPDTVKMRKKTTDEFFVDYKDQQD
jgi:uncharacterized protein (TIRG00374 family)